MTMQVVSRRGERKEVRVWRRGGREGLFLGVRKAGSFWEGEEEALMEGNLNDDEGKWGGGKERKEREEDKGVGNGEGWRNLGRESMGKALEEGEVSVNIDLGTYCNTHKEEEEEEEEALG